MTTPQPRHALENRQCHWLYTQPNPPPSTVQTAQLHPPITTQPLAHACPQVHLASFQAVASHAMLQRTSEAHTGHNYTPAVKGLRRPSPQQQIALGIQAFTCIIALPTPLTHHSLFRHQVWEHPQYPGTPEPSATPWDSSSLWIMPTPLIMCPKQPKQSNILC